MSQSTLRLIKRWLRIQPIEDVKRLPWDLRGIYVLYQYKPRSNAYNVVYIGMARGLGGMARRLRRHLRKKHGLWTHFAMFEVWDNITEEEVKELEGLFREIYKWDERANRLNKARTFKKFRKLECIPLKPK